MDAASSRAFIKELLQRNARDEGVTNLMLKAWIRNTWDDNGACCIDQVAATLSELIRNGSISAESAEDTLSSLLRKALSKSANDMDDGASNARRSKPKSESSTRVVKKVLPSEDNDGCGLEDALNQNRHNLDGELLTADVVPILQHSPVVVLSSNLLAKEEAPNNIGESMDLDSLKGLVCHRNSGTTQGRIKGMAISVAKNYWPQGFNERSCGFMIPENWARPVQIGLRNRETFATSFVALDKPLHLNLIKRMQRACCLRVLFNKDNTAEKDTNDGIRVYLRLGYRTVHQMLEKLINDPKHFRPGCSASAFVWGSRNYGLLRKGEPPRWVLEAEEWALACLQNDGMLENESCAKENGTQEEGSSADATVPLQLPEPTTQPKRRGRPPKRRNHQGARQTPRNTTVKKRITRTRSGMRSKPYRASGRVTRAAALYEQQEFETVLRLSEASMTRRSSHT